MTLLKGNTIYKCLCKWWIFWSILKRCLNDKKFPCVPHLFHNNKFITDFKEKPGLFNSFFFKQCSIINNGSKLPSNLVYHTNKQLSDSGFNSKDICKVISDLDSNKAHGHMISICMLMCGESIHKPLVYIFWASLKDEHFLSEWKKTNVVPIHKNDNKQILKNYRLVSLLPICAKIFE